MAVLFKIGVCWSADVMWSDVMVLWDSETPSLLPPPSSLNPSTTDECVCMAWLVETGAGDVTPDKTAVQRSGSSW